MINESQLLEYGGSFKDARQLERDYLLSLLLHEIYSVLSTELVFKGGTAIKYFYNLNRFSEDLDFSFRPSKVVPDRRALEGALGKALRNVSRQYEIKEDGHRTRKAGNEIVGVNYELRIVGPLNSRTAQLQNVNVDISLRDDMIMAPATKYFSPQYPDISTFPIPVMDAGEILSEKIASIVERDKMRDIYDVFYLISIKGLEYDEEMVKVKMAKRGEAFSRKTLLSKVRAASDKMKWKSELSYIISPLPDNSEVVSFLSNTFRGSLS